MTDRSLSFTADQILTPALESMYDSRASSFQHLNYRTGVYWHPFLAFRGQAAFMIARVAKLVVANRLSLAQGQDLLSYVASEYNAVPSFGKTVATGEVSFTRTTTTVAGDIPKGTKLTRRGNPTTQIPFKTATYETLLDAHYDVGQTSLTGVPIAAVSTGPDGNHPIRTDSVPHGVVVTGLFDKTITVNTFSAAGGIENVLDAYVRAYAKAFSRGQYGPTDDASFYAALQATGSANVLVFDIPGTGTQKVLVADQSWASSDRWVAQVQQVAYDAELIGNGCKVIFDKIRNKVISVNATVVLRDKNNIRETTDIDSAIRTAVASYFNDRKDWNIWKTDTLKSVIAHCHPKIFNCTAAVVHDTTGATVSEIAVPNYTQEQYHLALGAGAVTTTYVGPS